MGESERDDWRFAFNEFYHEFPIVFTGNTSPTEPKVWKFLGDEILFFIKLEKSTEALLYITAFKKTLAEYTTKSSLKSPGLSCKGSAWIVGFPVTNFMVTLEFEGGGRAPITDFIGPSLDCGFRIAHHSSQRKLVVSVELALMIATTMSNSGITEPILNYDGRIELKGVLDGKPYPLFWVDCASEMEKKEDALLHRSPGCTPSHVIAFCRDYIGGTKGLCLPFIEHDPDGYFKNIPEGLEKRREAISAVSAESSPDGSNEQDSNSDRAIELKLPTPHE